MKLQLLDAAATARRLKRLITDFDEIHIAVAWGYNGKLADLLLQNSQKFAAVTFGIDFFHTSPDLIDRLINVHNTYVARGEGPTFHPKIYFFTKGKKAEAIVGSANFTNGGLGKNHEACIHMSGSSNEPVFEDIKEAVRQYAQLGQPATQDIADSYRRGYKTAPVRKKVRGPFLPSDGQVWGLITTSWANYLRRIRRRPVDQVSARLDLLEKCRQILGSKPNFSGLSSAQWKAAAGTLWKNEANENQLGHIDWALFGWMSEAGDFAGLINAQNTHIARAVDAIPLTGDVTEEHYRQFCTSFLEAFQTPRANSTPRRKGGVPTASRLLAVKRPDCFVSINSHNLDGLARDLSFAPKTLKLENYWERVIEPIRQSDWYNAPRPRTRQDAKVWDGRVAMLDVIYYKP
ncbi:MAG: phospholipase D family protein [Oceanibaculum nanhaiense]|jgi:HKD family nuclease|uniref:phospholipase D family protein n=1 Tax=Oceanibaculum nanhaiense TaxID=1909734 RepID=UPI0032EAC4DB